MKVHDKASWHWEGKFPAGVAKEQAYVPAGLLLAWLAECGLLSADAEREFPDELSDLRAGLKTGPVVYRLMGGVLADDLLTPDASTFLSEYLDLDTGRFWDDYGRLTKGLQSDYHVPDTKESCQRPSVLVDARFSQWKAGRVS